jgi:RimJ/RimL family protein N-acetyltransferase
MYETQFTDKEQAIKHLQPRVNARRLEKDGDWVNLAVELLAAEVDDESQTAELGENKRIFIGELGLGLSSKFNRCYEVGYVFLPEGRGHGYAREGVRALLDILFNGLNAHRVVGRLDARNERSSKVLTSVGMQKEGVLRESEFVKGEWTDDALYSILDKEYQHSLR